MKYSKNIVQICCCLFFVGLLSGSLHASDEKGEADTIRYIANPDFLDPFFEKLEHLEETKRGKINIVHIGDSHIQADFFTNAIRQPLQDKFGNGGLGFTFPYNLLRTNGPRSTKYVSDAVWQKHFNLKPSLSPSLGLSGIAMHTSSQNFVVQLTVEDSYKFNKIKVIYPSEEQSYKMSVSAKLLKMTKNLLPQASGVKYHKIRSGENLSIVAQRYRVTVAQIKRANGLNNNVIRAGATLKIPTTATPTSSSKIEVSEDVDFVDLKHHKPYYSTYTSDSLLSQIMLFPDQKKAEYSINGFVLENNKPGVIYHTIGVNGTNLKDYNKYPLFFKQLPILLPDLVIVSLGTNESYGRVPTSDYMMEIERFVANVRKYNPNAIVMVTTPPPSFIRRRTPNALADSYATTLMKQHEYPVWDLFNHFDGNKGISNGGKYVQFINRDRVHYTERGYNVQGEMFVHDFMQAYNNFKLKTAQEK